MREVVWRVLGVLAALLLCSTAAQASVVPRGSAPADAIGEQHVVAAQAPADRSLLAASSAGTTTSLNDSGFDPDSVLMRVAVGPNGSATWQVEYRFQLTEDGERESFESFRRDIERNTSTYTARFTDRIQPSVTAAEDETDREMSLENVSVAVRRQRLAQPTGIVTYSFTWAQFAQANGSTIRVGDAIRGFYVGPKTTLTVTWPSDYRLTRSIPEPDTERQRRLSWQGELGFGPDEPLLVVTTAEPATGTTTTAQPADATTGGLSPVLLGLAGLLLAALGAGGVVAARNRDDEPAPAADGDTGDGADGTPAPDAELLSDEERALAVLDEQGGRVKQQQLADACEWNDSKASRVVSRLRDDDEVQVFRLGRENVISLPEETDDS